MSNADLVGDFHGALGETTPRRPQIPDVATLDLRASLITEEFHEVMQELGRLRGQISSEDPHVDLDALAPLAHELADLLYVTYGTFVGIGISADRVFEEVHRANLAKTAGPRRADGKQLKPDGWAPANVLGVIRAASQG